MTRIVPLIQGEAHISLRVSLGGTITTIKLNWLERFGYYTVDLFADGQAVALGRGLHPEVDLLESTNIPGRLFLVGSQPTPQNLNADNRLEYKE